MSTPLLFCVDWGVSENKRKLRLFPTLLLHRWFLLLTVCIFFHHCILKFDVFCLLWLKRVWNTFTVLRFYHNDRLNCMHSLFVIQKCCEKERSRPMPTERRECNRLTCGGDGVVIVIVFFVTGGETRLTARELNQCCWLNDWLVDSD